MSCSTCALRPGGCGANGELENRLKAQLCAMAGTPFWCHHGTSWKEGLRKGAAFQAALMSIARDPQHPTKGEIARAQMPISLFERPKVCEGWKKAVCELARQGWFNDTAARLRRQIARTALADLFTYCDDQSNDSAAKVSALDRMRESLAILYADLEEKGISPKVLAQ